MRIASLVPSATEMLFALGLGDDVVVGHRADRAQRLGDDQVRLQALQARLVELVDRPPLLGQLAHGAVDLGRRQPGPDDVARDARQLARRRRVVALVRDGGDLVAQAEREEHLRGRGDERHDAHDREDRTTLRRAAPLALRRRPMNDDDSSRSSGAPRARLSDLP